MGCLWQLKGVVWGRQSPVGLCGPSGCSRGCGGSRAVVASALQAGAGGSRCQLSPAASYVLAASVLPFMPGITREFSGFVTMPSIGGVITSFLINLPSARLFCRVCWRKKRQRRSLLSFLSSPQESKSCKTFICSLMKWEENALLTSLVALYLPLGSLREDDKGLCVLFDLRISKAQ